MLRLNLGSKDKLRVLCLGAHSDDIEIGCGGAVLNLARQFPNSEFHWIVFSAIGVRGAEAKRSANQFLSPEKLKKLGLYEFADGFLPYLGADVKKVFEQIKKDVIPDVIFTHNRDDAHQDHRTLAEMTWNTFRDHLILEYEIPKYDGDMGQPMMFVPLEKEIYERKVEILMDSFESQRVKRWFQPETFLALMRLRGMECNSASGYAEAFYTRKFVL
jgi:LmbE family N-acetylglucosaminyl deacetylase